MHDNAPNSGMGEGGESHIEERNVLKKYQKLVAH